MVGTFGQALPEGRTHCSWFWNVKQHFRRVSLATKWEIKQQNTTRARENSPQVNKMEVHLTEIKLNTQVYKYEPYYKYVPGAVIWVTYIT